MQVFMPCARRVASVVGVSSLHNEVFAVCHAVYSLKPAFCRTGFTHNETLLNRYNNENKGEFLNHL